MRAIVLAAGRGSRLMPFTQDRPKCAVELHGHPLYEWLLGTIRAAGIRDITMVRGYLADRLAPEGVRLRDNPAFETTNMVCSLWHAEADLGAGAIVSYSDILYEHGVLEAILESPHDVSVVLDRNWRALWQARFDDPLSDAESLKVNGEGRIVDIGAKADDIDEIAGQYIGLIKFSGAGVAALRDRVQRFRAGDRIRGRSFETMYMTDLLQALIDDGCALHPVWIEGRWLEIDSVDDLRLAETMVRPLGDGPAAGFRIAAPA